MTGYPDPHDLPAKVLGLVVGLSLIGGLAAYLERLRRHAFDDHWLLELATDVLYSVAAGFSAWYLVIGLIQQPYIAAAVAIAAGHLGARWMTLLQRAITRRLNDNGSTD